MAGSRCVGRGNTFRPLRVHPPFQEGFFTTHSILRSEFAQPALEQQGEPFPAFVDGKAGPEKGLEALEIAPAEALVEIIAEGLERGPDFFVGRFGGGKGRGELDEDLGPVFPDKLVAETNGQKLGDGIAGGEEMGAGFDRDGFLRTGHFALGKNPDEGPGILEQAGGVADGKGGLEAVGQVDAEGPDPGEKRVMPQLLFLHHAVKAFPVLVPGEKENGEPVPPVAVVGEGDASMPGIQVPQVFQAFDLDRVELAAEPADQIKIQKPFKEGVFSGGNQGGGV